MSVLWCWLQKHPDSLEGPQPLCCVFSSMHMSFVPDMCV